MTLAHKSIGTLIVALLVTSCSQQITNTQSTNYVAVDPNKFESTAAINAAISVAKNECSRPKNANDYQTGRNAVSAVRASNDELSGAAVDACMAGRGFLRKE